MPLRSATWIALLLWTLCGLICHRHHLTVAGLMVIDHLHRLMGCIQVVHHLPHPMGKAVPYTTTLMHDIGNKRREGKHGIYIQISKTGSDG